MNDEDKILRDLLVSSASNVEISDEPTIISLYDTIVVLACKNPNWREDSFSCSIFAWQSSHFQESHVKEVCEKSCPELLELCQEYREHKTIKGRKLSNTFGLDALEYVAPAPAYEPDYLILLALMPWNMLLRRLLMNLNT